jgi:hypothetical protein
MNYVLGVTVLESLCKRVDISRSSLFIKSLHFVEELVKFATSGVLENEVNSVFVVEVSV